MYVLSAKSMLMLLRLLSKACLGLTYKPNVGDLRNSPAIKIAELLADKFDVLKVDPYVVNSCSLTTAIAKAEMKITSLMPQSSIQNLRSVHF